MSRTPEPDQVGRDIGGGHRVVMFKDDGAISASGLIDYHLKPDGSPCGGSSIRFDLPENLYVPPEAKWQLISLNPLHLEPSLLCRICGDHGFIRNGRWEKA